MKPVELSDDKKCLKVKFFWLRKLNSPPAFINICQTPLLESRDERPYRSCLWNHATKEAIKSGDEILLTTEDPENLPLPSWELLEMQWFLNRVIAMSGAADVEDDFNHDGDNSGLPCEADFDMLDEWDEEEEASQSMKSTMPSSPLSLSPPLLGPPKTNLSQTIPTRVSSSTDAFDTEAF